MPQLLTADGAAIHFELAGSGPLVLLVHGGTGTSAYDWEHQRVALAARFRIVLMDMRGHGRSSDPQWLLGMDRVGEDIVALLDDLGEQPLGIISFSVGASAVVRLMARRADVARSAILIGPSISHRPELFERVIDGPWPQELIDLHHEHGDREHWRRLRHRLAHDVLVEGTELDAEGLAKIACPVLVVSGDRDSIEPVETALAITRALPRGELLVLPRATHFAQRDRPEEFNAAAIAFLERVAAADEVQPARDAGQP